LIAAHGHSTYGGNSHLIADADEAWVVIEFAGGAGLWVAERLGPDAIRVSRPGYVGRIPIEGDGGRTVEMSENFVDFAVARGWHVANGRPFDVNAVYGDGKGRWEGVALIEDELARRSRRPEKIGLDDVIDALRDGRFTGDSAGYGQIAPLHGPRPAETRMMWHAHVGPVAAPFTPVPLGLLEAPHAFRQHRYLSTGEAETFIDRRRAETRSRVPQSVEATRSATVSFKRLQYLAMLRHETLLPEVQAIWRAEERRLQRDYAVAERLAALALEAGESEAACLHLTYVAQTELMRSLDTADALARALELKIRVEDGLRIGTGPAGPEQIW
ncbi:MAG TPA: dipeptidase, partial [Methylomirabilota bacterium]|nr:dipeptidase [Methylomirabilota bacterium]